MMCIAACMAAGLLEAEIDGTDRFVSSRSLDACAFLVGKSLQLSLLWREAFTLNSDMY